MDKIKSLAFYQAWIDTITSRKDHLLKIWRNAREFTSCIMGDEYCVMGEVAEKLNLLCYPRDYYFTDTVTSRKKIEINAQQNE